MRSIGRILRMPVIGLVLRSPTIFSSSCITCFTSELRSWKTPADMPAIQSMSNISIVSMRWRSSRSVPDRISMLRSSSGRTACASRAKGSRMRSISRTPTYLRGTICTENPDGSARIEPPSCGVTFPRTAAACGTTR